MNQNTALAALAFSLAIHVGFGAAFPVPPGATPFSSPDKDPIYVSYMPVPAAKTTPPVAAEPKPIPPIKPEAVKKVLTEKSLENVKKYYLKTPRPMPDSLKPKAAPAVIAAPVKAAASLQPAVKSGADLAVDPSKGKVFARYFGSIKDKINQAVGRRYSGEGEGKVTVLFVVSENGKLQSVSVIEKQSEADLAAKRLVIDCVKDAAPFGVFPPELGNGRIAFNLTILFEDL